MNILFIVDNIVRANLGGVERVTLLLAQELRKRGHETAILSLKAPDTIPEKDHEIPEYFIKYNSSSYKEDLNKLLKELKIDKIILQGVYNQILGTLNSLPSDDDLAIFLVHHNKPFHFHGYEKKIMRLTPWRDLNYRQKILKTIAVLLPQLHRKIITQRTGNTYRFIIDRVDRFVLLSERFKKKVVNLLPEIESAKVVAINNPNTFVSRPFNDTIVKENIVVYVGRLDNPQKNLFDFIRVWKEFYKANEDWKAFVIGDGEHKETIKKFAEKQKAKNLIFLGNKKDVEEYYRKAKIICLTSNYEGWGMVLTEAQAYGCVPVVFDTYESVYDIIQSEENGIVVNAFDIMRMAGEMSLIARDENLFEKLSENGRESIKRFEIDKIADQWEEMLNSI